MPSQLLNPDPGWQAIRRALDCNLERRAVKQRSSSNVETEDNVDSWLELQGGGYKNRDCRCD